MSDEAARRNAEIVVAAWRSGHDDAMRDAAWRPPARDMPPSATTRLVANAWANVARTADTMADQLAASGFLPGHEVMRSLRTVASQAAHRQQRAVEWADALEWAEARS